MAPEPGLPPDRPAERLFEFGGRRSRAGMGHTPRQCGQGRALAREHGDAPRYCRMCGEIGYHVAPALVRKFAVDECVQLVFEGRPRKHDRCPPG